MDNKLLDTENRTDEEECISVHVFEDETEDDSEQIENSVLSEIRSRESSIDGTVPKSTNLSKKLSDIWYHYKVPIIVALCAVAVIIYITIASLPGKYDVTAAIYVSYTDYASSVTGDIREELTEYSQDWNEDGKVTVGVSDYNMGASRMDTALANSTILIEHLTGEPSSMLWILDEELYSVIVYSYGEEMFESYEGAPLWIEITWNAELNERIENGECPRIGICLRRMTDELSENDKLTASYESAKLLLSNLKEAHPEAFE